MATPSCPGCIERDRRIAILEAKLEQAHALIAELQAKVAELERRLSQNSHNFSRPPSSDPPGTAGRKRSPSGRRPGAQPGHPDQQRELLPPDQVDKFVTVKPEACSNCGTRLRGSDPDPVRHQVTEVPPTRPYVTEYPLHTLSCHNCARLTPAPLPSGVPPSAFWPRLHAVIAALTGVYHVSRRSAVEGVRDRLGVRMSLGALSACEQRVSEAVAKPIADAHEFVKSRAVVYVDETGYRERKRRAWLWVAVTSFVTVFLVQGQRSSQAARKLLGRFVGTVVSDRAKAYGCFSLRKRQLCWAHLIRAFQGFSEGVGEIARVGSALLEEAKVIFEWWNRVRDGTLKRATFQRRMEPVIRRVEALLEQGTCSDQVEATTCLEILAVKDAMWRFVDTEGVEPTNNASERQIRQGVMWRKTSLGTQSERGSRYVERIMTVGATLKQQGRNVLDFLTEACDAALHGLPPPSLLPGPGLHRSRRVA